jgi:hypothetical protein
VAEEAVVGDEIGDMMRKDLEILGCGHMLRTDCEKDNRVRPQASFYGYPLSSGLDSLPNLVELEIRDRSFTVHGLTRSKVNRLRNNSV